MIRWLDFNDTWLAAEWGHPSDNLGGILATADWLSRTARAAGRKPLTMRDVLVAMIQAHEIQGCLALENSFNAVGRPRAAREGRVDGRRRPVARHARRADQRSVNAFVDATRCAPTATRRTPARASPGGRRCNLRAVRLADRETGEMGYRRRSPGASTTCCSTAKPFRFQRPYGTYVMENVLFKIAFPAEFHAQTAAEAALQLHAQLPPRAARPTTSAGSRSARTQPRSASSTSRAARQSGRPRPLHPVHGRRAAAARPADRGRLRRLGRRRSSHRRARAKTVCVEDPQFTQDYHDPDKRSIANALTIEFADGSKLAGWRSNTRSATGAGPKASPGREVQDQPCPPLPGQAATSDSRRVAGRQSSKRCRSMSTSTCM